MHWIVTLFEGEGLLVKRANLVVSEPNLAAELLAVKRDYEPLVGLLEKAELLQYSIADADRELQSTNLGSDYGNIQEYPDKQI